MPADDPPAPPPGLQRAVEPPPGLRALRSQLEVIAAAVLRRGPASFAAAPAPESAGSIPEHAAPPGQTPALRDPHDHFDSDGDGETARPPDTDAEDSSAAPSALPGYEPEDGQQQVCAFGNWRADVRSSWRQVTSGATPVAVTSQLALNWEAVALHIPVADVYLRDRDWANDAGIACIPAGPDGLDQICRISRHDPEGPDGPGGTQADPTTIFAVDTIGGAAMALQAALTAGGCHATLILLTTVHTQGAWYGRLDTTVVGAMRQWGARKMRNASRLSYGSPWLTLKADDRTRPAGGRCLVMENPIRPSLPDMPSRCGTRVEFNPNLQT